MDSDRWPIGRAIAIGFAAAIACWAIIIAAVICFLNILS